MKNNLKLFSGFAGIGGFDNAFRNVFPDGEIIGHSEVDPHCNKCNSITTHRLLNHFISQCQVCGTKKKQWASGIYNYHFGDTRNYGDTTIIIPRDLPDFNIYTFGWPCQDNSIAGKRRGQKADTRSGLLFRSVEIIRVKKPEYFVAENVKGLFSVNEGIDIIETVRLLAYLNDSLPQYDIQLQLLNTRWLLPQNRERVFIVGSLRDKPRPEIFPITESDFDNGEKPVRKNKSYTAGTLNTKNQSPNWSFDASSTFIEAISGHPRTGKGHGGKGVLKNDKNFYSVDATNKQLVQVGSLDKNNSEAVRVYDPGRIRRLTPLECCKLQGFNKPLEQNKNICWTKYAIDEQGKKVIVPETHQYKAIGNSVTVNVVELILRKLKECIQK